LLRGHFVMNGYPDQPEATREAIDTGGWLHTGDLATLDDRGYLRITGRLKEIINRCARKIAPGEIEALLNSHPAVAKAAVTGVPDQRLGEEIAAFVHLVPGATATEHKLARLCAFVVRGAVGRRALVQPSGSSQQDQLERAKLRNGR
jgi:acyl-CoA synthetase (AMP-forming)/AMP-acid ligase II